MLTDKKTAQKKKVDISSVPGYSVSSTTKFIWNTSQRKNKKQFAEQDTQ